MFAQAVLHTGESENQPKRPKTQQREQRHRSKVRQETFAPVRGLNMPPHSGPDAPGFLVEPGRHAKKSPLDAPRQNDGLKRINQDDEDESNAEDRCPPMHKRWSADVAGLVADSGRYTIRAARYG